MLVFGLKTERELRVHHLSMFAENLMMQSIGNMVGHKNHFRNSAIITNIFSCTPKCIVCKQLSSILFAVNRGKVE